MSEPVRVILRSPANATVKHLVRLRENRYRRKTQRVIVDGWRETAQAIAAGLELIALYRGETDAPVAGDEAIDAVLSNPSAVGKTTWLSDSILEKISYGQSVRGVVAEFAQPDDRLDELSLPPSPLVLVLDRIEKPGNLGAVFRCADAAGVDAVLLSDCSDRFNPNAIRNSVGAVFSVPAAAGDQASVASFLAERGFRVLAARVESSTPLWSVDLTGPIAIVMGNEASGLGDRWRSLPGRQGNDPNAKSPTPVGGVRIPMAGRVDSLNISVSAAVIAFEAGRQRGTFDRIG